MRFPVRCLLAAAVFVGLIGGCGKTDLIVSASEPVKAFAGRREALPPELVFRPIKDVIPPGKTTIINGKPVSAKDWPVLLIAEITKIVDGEVVPAVCTSTLIGPRVLLTAAHCIDAGTSVGRVKLDLLGDRVSATCEMHPDYAKARYRSDSPRNSSDYALCLLEEDLSAHPAARNWVYENVDRDTPPAKLSRVLMLGYGCTRIDLKPNCKPKFPPIDTTLRAGGGVISGHPTPGGERDYLRTRSISEREAALCSGDSGGPLVTGASLDNQTARRAVVAVNSSIDYPGCDVRDLTSRFSALGAPSFRTWSDTWRAKNGMPLICGISQEPGVFPCRA